MRIFSTIRKTVDTIKEANSSSKSFKSVKTRRHWHKDPGSAGGPMASEGVQASGFFFCPVLNT